jgi:hypothetical protein
VKLHAGVEQKHKESVGYWARDESLLPAANTLNVSHENFKNGNLT